MYVTDKTARRSFSVRPGPNGGYWMECKRCGEISKGWDYISNCLNAGFVHVHRTHGVKSPRGKWASDLTMFRLRA